MLFEWGFYGYDYSLAEERSSRSSGIISAKTSGVTLLMVSFPKSNIFSGWKKLRL